MITQTKFVEKSIILPESMDGSIESNVLHDVNSEDVIWKEINGRYYITPFSEIGVPLIVTNSSGGIANGTLFLVDYQASFYSSSISYNYINFWFYNNQKISLSAFSLVSEYEANYKQLVDGAEHSFIKYTGDLWYSVNGSRASESGGLKPDYDVTLGEYVEPLGTFNLVKCDYNNETWDVLSSQSRFGEYTSPSGKTRIIGFEEFRDNVT